MAARRKRSKTQVIEALSCLLLDILLITIAPGAITAADETQFQQDAAARAANSEMHRQMKEVASWLEQYTLQNQRWPEPGDEQRWAKGQLIQIVPPTNPYDADSASNIENVSDINPNPSVDEDQLERKAENSGKIQFALDTALSQDTVSAYSDDPPENWQASPGTITAVTNNKNFFLVWGAGKDSLPIRDLTTGKPLFVVGKYYSP